MSTLTFEIYVNRFSHCARTSRNGDFKTYIHSKCTKNQSILQILRVNLWLKTFYTEIAKVLLGRNPSFVCEDDERKNLTQKSI